MVSERVPSEGLAQTTRQMGGGADGHRHPRTGRQRETDRWTRTGRRTDRGAGRERSQKHGRVWGERNRQESWRQRSKEGDKVTEMGEGEIRGESERQEEIKREGETQTERKRLEAANHKQGFDENLEGVFSCFPPQTPRPAKSPFLPPPAQFPAAKEVRKGERGREKHTHTHTHTHTHAHTHSPDPRDPPC